MTFTLSTSFKAKEGEERRWVLIDAEGLAPGRLAAVAADLLRGKGRADYAPQRDCGDGVIVINAGKVVFTGRKLTDKVYYRHTGYPGGLRTTTPERELGGARPERVLRWAVRGMMPRNRLSRAQLKNFKVYAGSEHPHEAQNPEVLDVRGMNRKNVGAAR